MSFNNLRQPGFLTGLARATGTAAILMVAAGLPAPYAYAEVGDLDPSFVDHGRLGQIPGAAGVARSVELLDEGGLVVGGGYFRVTRNYDWMWNPRSSCRRAIHNFVGQLREDGGVDEAFSSAEIASTETYGIARQAGGGTVAVGREIGGNVSSCLVTSTLVVFRLTSDGTLDSAFGTNGIFRLSIEGSSLASSLVLEPDGRILVAGAAYVTVADSTESRLVVLRLLANGSLDPSFGEQGIYVGPVVDFSHELHLVRTEAGSYRVTTAMLDSCAIAGVTTDGVPDAAFGNAGIQTVMSALGLPMSCESLDVSTDGRLIVVGSDGERGTAARLLANGAPDATFAADAAIGNSMARVTSITAIADGKMLLAGVGVNGSSIMRLEASGARDATFGDEGRTWIDLFSEYGATPLVHDMTIRDDGSVIAVGGDSTSNVPFVVRLVGDAGGTSPGVLSFAGDNAVPLESDGQAIVRVRRSGGSDGAISVSYQAIGDSSATADEDFTTTSGTLHWPDGDASEREIVVEVIQDAGPAEIVESFAVKLENAQGGAGLGKYLSTVDIQPDGAPGGQIEIGGADPTSGVESNIQVWLHRSYYFEGRVCVSLTANSGTAIAGEDFDGTPNTYCWDDQDAEAKLAEIPIVDDNKSESNETFNVELSNPTGGAIIGPVGSVTLGIAANDEPASPPPPPPPLDDVGSASGGGGPAGPVELLLCLGLLIAESRRRRSGRLAI